MGIAYNDTLVAPPLGADTVQEAIDALKNISGGPLLTPLDIYVAPATAAIPGNDANNGITPATPVLTMAGAFSKITHNLLGAPVRIHTAADLALSMAGIPDFNAYNADGQIIIIGDGAGQVGENGFVEVVAPTASGAGSTPTSIDITALAPLDDQYLGLTLLVTSGAAIGRTVLVRNNTPTALIPTAALAGFLAGDSFTLLAPSTTIDISASPIQLMAGTHSLFPTLVNIAVFGGGSNNALAIDNVTSLKLYGVLFISEAQLSIQNSTVFAGVSSADTAVEDTELHLGSLEAAITGSPVPFLPSDASLWQGWGVSNVDSHLNNQDYPMSSLTGYVVSFGQLTIGGLPGLIPAAVRAPSLDQFDITLLGGYFGGAFLQHGELEIREGSGVPVLIRTGEAGFFALGLISVVSQVLGGDRALVLENTLTAAILQFNQSKLDWSGPFTAASNGGAGLGYITSADSEVYIRIADDEALTVTLGVGGAAGFLTQRGVLQILSNFLGIGASPTFNFSIDDGALALGIGASTHFLSNVNDIGAQFIMTSTAPGLQNGAVVIGQSAVAAGLFLVCTDLELPVICGGLAGVNSVLNNCFLGFVSQLGGNLVAESEAPVTTIGPPVFCSALGSRMRAAFADTVSISGPILGAAVMQSVDDANLFAIFNGALTLAPGETVPLFLAAEHASLTVAVLASATCDGLNILARRLSEVSVYDGGVWTSNADDNFNIHTGSRIVFGGPNFSFIAAENNLDVSGGGQAYFDDGTPVFSAGVGFNELVVGPSSGEQDSFLGALPAAKDSFSSIGAGSSITRNL